MTKKRIKAQGRKPSQSEQAASQHSLEEFAQDLGRVLGNAQLKAEGWIGQRKVLVDHLVNLRNTANDLLAQLGNQAESIAQQSRSMYGRVTGTRSRKPTASDFAPPPLSKQQRRKRATLSPEARERIAAAQRKRWAKLKKKQGT